LQFQFKDPATALQTFHLLRQAAVLLTAAALAYSPLSEAEIGQFEQIWFLANTLSYFGATGLQQALLSLYPKLNEEQKDQALGMAAGLLLLLGLVFVLLFWFLPGWAIPLFTGRADLPFPRLSLGFLLLFIPGTLVEYAYLLLRRSGELLGYGILNFGVQTALILLPAFGAWGIEGVFWGLFLSAALRALFLLVLVFRFGNIQFPKALLESWLSLAWPLVLYALLGSFILFFSHWLLNFHSGGDEELFAIYRYGARELPYALALVTALNAAFIPNVASDLGQALPEIKRRSRRLMHILFLFSIVLVTTAPWWFVVVFSAKFAASVPLFQVFSLLLIPRVVFSQAILNGLEENRAILYISLAEVAFTVIMASILVQFWGMYGIAWAVIGGYGLEKGLQVWYLWKRKGIGPGSYLDFAWLGFYGVVLILIVVSC
jgi:O-antigen/teichoic acid export membrane protein